MIDRREYRSSNLPIFSVSTAEPLARCGLLCAVSQANTEKQEDLPRATPYPAPWLGQNNNDLTP